MKKILILLSFIIGIQVCVCAQSDYISSHELKSKEVTDIWLGGKAKLSILSPHDDLAFKLIPEMKDEIKPAVKVDDGYRYDILLNIDEGNRTTRRKFSIGRLGKTIQANFQLTFQANQHKFYSIAEVENPIQVNQLDGVGLGSTDENYACVEIDSPIPLDFKCSESLNYQIKTNKTSQGTLLTILTINISDVKSKSQEYLKMKADYDSLQEKEIWTDEEEERVKHLQEQLPILMTAYNEMVNISFKGEKTNSCYINIENLGAKARLRYAVILMKETEKVFVTQYQQFMDSAEENELNMKYRAAIGFYEQANAASDKPAVGTEFIAEKIAMLKECEELNKTAGHSLKKYQDLRKQGLTTESELLKYLEGAADCYNVLYEKTRNPLAQQRLQKVRQALARTPWIIEGKVFFTRFKSGKQVLEPAVGVSIYFRNKYGTGSEKVGETDETGKYHIQLDKSSEGALEFSKYHDKELFTHSIRFNSGNKEHIKWNVNFYNK